MLGVIRFLRFDGYNKQWHLHDFQNTLLRSYYQDDVKLMVVWNMHCFANQSQKAEFHARKNKPLSLEQIMQKFKEDLKKRNRLPSENIEPIGNDLNFERSCSFLELMNFIQFQIYGRLHSKSI